MLIHLVKKGYNCYNYKVKICFTSGTRSSSPLGGGIHGDWKCAPISNFGDIAPFVLRQSEHLYIQMSRLHG